MHPSIPGSAAAGTTNTLDMRLGRAFFAGEGQVDPSPARFQKVFVASSHGFRVELFDFLIRYTMSPQGMEDLAEDRERALPGVREPDIDVWVLRFHLSTSFNTLARQG
jgi:hypothetical protein